MTTADDGHHDSHDDHHGHGEFIAHHFDNAEQQFDSGKLGIWLFLVTEVLFFSGLFCAYTLYRYHHPDLFYAAHFHLDKILGGLNTIVLLFSSLTMALAVRASQMGKKDSVVINLGITMVCAAIFLGIKAVEYSHKWDIGIFTRGSFALDESHHAEGLSPYLIKISIPFLIALIGSAAAALFSKVSGKDNLFKFFMYVTLMFGGYFMGAAGGQFYMQIKEDMNGGHGQQVAHADDHDEAEKMVTMITTKERTNTSTPTTPTRRTKRRMDRPKVSIPI